MISSKSTHDYIYHVMYSLISIILTYTPNNLSLIHI